VVAEVAKEMGILTVGVVTTPLILKVVVVKNQLKKVLMHLKHM
jgi:cell division GTPase FtsZ